VSVPSVDELLDAYRTAFRAGGSPDPAAFLAQVTGDDRRELEALIEAFLAVDAGAAFDPAAFAAFEATPLTRRIDAALAESWATLLPAARDAAQLKRSTLTQRLAAALGVGDREEKVARYYHRMETGTLEGAGVSDRVLEALSAIVGVPREHLRAAGRRMAPPPSASGGPVFARSAAMEAAPAAPLPAQREPPDLVDELFTGG
jgi:hypothetical protein